MMLKAVDVKFERINGRLVATAVCPRCGKKVIAEYDEKGKLLWYPYEGQEKCIHYRGIYAGGGGELIAYFDVEFNYKGGQNV